MHLINRITLHFKKVKEKRIEFLAKKIVEELEIYGAEFDVQSIAIYFDYKHHPKREIHVQVENFELIIETGEVNKRFKKSV